MDQTHFNTYKSVKKKFDYTYKGYNLQYLVPGYLGFLFSGETPTGRDVFKEFYTSGQSIDFSKALETKASTLITYLINRTDYKELALAAQELYSDSEVVNLSELPQKRISLFSITYIKHFWLACWIILSHSIGSGIISKLYYMALCIKILNQIEWIEKTKSTPQIKRYVCFNSAYKEEAVLTAYFNKLNIETITMQHGIFCDFKLTIPFDIINHENLTAQKLLCWGQSTVDYMSARGMDASRFILEGNLKYKNIEIGNIHQTFRHCLVLLGRGNYIDTNNKLLEALTKFNKQNENPIVFYIKKHPFLMDEEHKQFANISNNMIFLGKEHSTQEILKSDLVDFSIAVNTTAYYESLALGKPCLRWSEAENEEFFGMDDKFTNIEEFSQKINLLKKMNTSEIQSEVKKVIKYIFNPNLTIL